MHKVAFAAIAAAFVFAPGVSAPAEDNAPVSMDRAGLARSYFSSLPSESTPFCVEVVSKQLDSSGFSKTVSRTCSSQSVTAASIEDARISGSDAALAGTLLLTEYRDTNFGGGQLYNYIGQDGPCDYAGYRLRNLDSVYRQVSSVVGSNNCKVMLGSTKGGSSYQYGIIPGAPSIGPLNDNLYSLRIYSSTG